MKQVNKVSSHELVQMAFLTALLEASKLAMASIPNVEPVTLLLILYTLYFGWYTLLIAAAYILLETLIWGLNIWVLMYMYIWPILIALVMQIRSSDSVWTYALLAAAFGLFFGAMCSLVYLFIAGPVGALSWWITGIPFDILHSISNFFMVVFLLKPLRHLFDRTLKNNAR